MRKFIPLGLLLIVGLVFGNVFFNGANVSAPDDDTSVTGNTVNDEGDGVAALIRNQRGQAIGILQMVEGDDGSLTGLVVLQNVSPGFHGVHIHETGDCRGDFSSAGAHFDLGNNEHPNHTGDLPSLMVEPNRLGAMLFLVQDFGIDDLLADDGTAIIVHSGADNFGNIPSRYGGPDAETLKAGDSGDRMGCGVIQEADSIPELHETLLQMDIDPGLLAPFQN